MYAGPLHDCRFPGHAPACRAAVLTPEAPSSRITQHAGMPEGGSRAAWTHTQVTQTTYVGA